MNRVTEGIEKMRKQIANRLATGQTTQAKVDAGSKSLDMSFKEYAIFNTRKSAAAGGKLTPDEAMTIYKYLGEGGPEKFNRQSLAVKMILMKIFGELLEK